MLKQVQHDVLVFYALYYNPTFYLTIVYYNNTYFIKF
jgi:hypothetical protein